MGIYNKNKTHAALPVRLFVAAFVILGFALASQSALAAAPTLDPIGPQSVDEGATLDVPLSASDDDGDSLTFSASNLPSFCSLTDNNDSTADLQCTPGFTDAGIYTNVTITVSDGNVVEDDSETITITVNEVNRAPVLTPIGNQSVAEGATLDIPLLASDADGDALTFSASNLPSFCILTDSVGPDGNLRCAPGFTDEGTYLAVTITVTDGNVADDDSESFTITVGGTNQAPVLTPIGNQSVAEGAILDIPLAASDADGDALTFSASNLPSFCILTDSTGPNGNVRCTPGFTDAGTYLNATITVTDGNVVDNDSESFTITVGGTNQAPVLTPIGNQSVAEGATLDIPLSASDADGDALTFSASNLPSFCFLTDSVGPSGNLRCTPGFADEGTYPNATITVTDGNVADDDSESFTITVGGTNQAPVLTPIGNQSVAEGAILDIPLAASDADGDALTFSASNLPSFCILTDSTGPTGNLRCAPGFADEGTYLAATITVTDGNVADDDSESFTITVGGTNQAPVLTPIGNQSVAEGAILDIPLLASDADGDALTFSASNLPSFCILTDSTGPDGNLRCAPGFTDEGTYLAVTITVTDGNVADDDSESFTITVGGTNQAPVLTPIGEQSVAEGAILDIPLSASDPDGDALTFSASNLPSFCILTDSVGPDGNLRCAPGFTDEGIFLAVTITVTDGNVADDDSESFTITVTDTNQPPVLAPIDDQSVIEAASVSIPLSATDPDGDGLGFSTAGLPGFCLLTDNGNGTGAIDCSPLVGDAGTYAGIEVIATDDGAVPASASGFFTLTVDPNQAPTASGVTIEVAGGGEPALGDLLTGTYTYADAEDDLEGVSTFRWLRDGVEIPGATDSTYTVTTDDIETTLVFEVTPVAQTGELTGTPVGSAGLLIPNSVPLITDQNIVEFDEDTSREITLADVIVDDSDNVFPDDFTITIQGGPDYTRVGNVITPVPDFFGDLTVPVTVNDGFDDSAVFNLTATVLPINDAPVITDQVALSTPEDTSLVVAVTDLVILDPDNVFPTDFTLELQDGLNYTQSGATVTPDANFNGTLNVGVTVSDGELPSAVFVLTIEVTAENDDPVLVSPIDPQFAIERSEFNLSIAANFDDVDGDTLTYTASGLPPSGNLRFDTQTGVFSGTPQLSDARDNDPYIVVVTASDGQPGSLPAQTQFELVVSALDRANVALDIAASPDPAILGDSLSWTLTTTNVQGPQGANNVAITGSVVGQGLTITADASCTLLPEVGGVSDFDCALGALPVGGSVAVRFTIDASSPGDVVIYATAANVEEVPIDPNLDDNAVQKVVGVAERYSNGVVQVLGTSDVRSVAAGDVNGDGATDLVVGTAAGQALQVYLSDGFRDFASVPIAVADTGEQTGVALADFDGNGFLDIVVANGGGRTDAVYTNDGIGNFTLRASLGPTFANDVAVGDFDNDGNTDIAFATVTGNPVYLGDGTGDFTLHDTLGSAVSNAVAVGRFDTNNRDDLVFANSGGASQVWTKRAASGFARGSSLPIGDAMAVVVGEFGGDTSPDIAFGRVPSDADDVPPNPVLINDGNGGFAAATDLLGASGTSDILAGDVNRDGRTDLVFINTNGVHQIWIATNSFDLWAEQIFDLDSTVGVLAELGMADMGEPGGVDLAMGGALSSGIGIYLNDGQGNLGMGDAVPPVIALVGESSVSVPSGSVYTDAGATAEDNIDGDVSRSIVVSNNVNTAVVGDYTVRYNVTDRAGNSAVEVRRTVTVTPAAGTGGGGGGAISTLALLLLIVFSAMRLYREERSLRGVRFQESGPRKR